MLETVDRPPIAALEITFDPSRLLGEANCANCNYGVVRVPERCPMCGDNSWKPQQPLTGFNPDF